MNPMKSIVIGAGRITQSHVWPALKATWKGIAGAVNALASAPPATKRLLLLIAGIALLYAAVGDLKIGGDLFGKLIASLPDAFTVKAANARCEYCWAFHHLGNDRYLTRVRCGDCDSVVLGREMRKYFDLTQSSSLPGLIRVMKQPPKEGWGDDPSIPVLIPVADPRPTPAPTPEPEPQPRRRATRRQPTPYYGDGVLPYLNGGF